jgi:hypothetical protein
MHGMPDHRFRLVHIAVVSIVATLLGTVARAQVDVDSAVAHAGAGAGISFIKPSSNDGQSSEGVVFVYHWHSFHSGWGPSFGLDWHSTDYNQTMGSVSTTLGTLQTRALLVGYGHTKKIKRFATSANMNGGYSFNNYSVASTARPAFAAGGISLVNASVDNSWVVRPDVSAWYDVFKHMAVGISAAYLWSRPNQTVTTLGSSDTRRLNADAFELTVGVAVGVWKKRS